MKSALKLRVTDQVGMSGRYALLKPSEALNRRFDAPDIIQEVQKLVHYHGVLIGHVGLLLATDKSACEVFDDSPICQLPNTPPWLLGMTNQRGNIVPVFDLDCVFTRARKKNVMRQRRFLLVGKKDETVGISIVDFPVRLTFVAEEGVRSYASLPAVLQPHIRQCYSKDEQIWIDWNIDSFFTELAATH